MKLLKKLLLVTLLLILLLLASAFGYYTAVTKNLHLSPEKLALSGQTLVLYDGEGNKVKHTACLQGMQTVHTDDIPLHTRLAFVCVEDKRFYTHSGFDFKRIARALVNNAKAGTFKEGASTISQQLIKNTHLTQDKTVKRKLQEWKLTKQLERRYTKDEILEKYLNTIYFGHDCFGIRAAAEFYFGKEPKELTLADSAILAGLVKSPNNYSPFKNPERCQKRKQTVLSIMQKNGKITESDKLEASVDPLPIAKVNEKNNRGFLHFVFDELENIAEEKNIILGGNIEIYTALNPALQEEMFIITNEDIACDKTLLAVDGKTGNFTACISTVGNIRRLPGSLIKPLLVYAPAVEENLLSPATPILDEKVNYGGYQPENYDGSYHGFVSARDALAKSLNIPAVKTLQSLGINKGISYLEKLNLSVDSTDGSLALALGGMKNGFTLRELASAYTSLQNGGTMKLGGFITELKLNGRSVYKRKTVQKSVFSEETAYLTTDMLQTATKSGTAKKLRALPFQIAAKTGTTGTSKGNTDAYALSYTCKDLIAVWLGNADNSVIPYTGGGLPCNYLLRLNEFLYKNKLPADFVKPQGVTEIALDKTAYFDTHTMLLADDLSPVEYRLNELFKQSALPTKKSDFFSNPSISPPSLELENGRVCIRFDKGQPTCYEYTIERYDYATSATIYSGKYITEFYDDQLEKDKRYIYIVTPSFHGKKGIPIPLPEVSTKKQEEILGKEWWEY